MCVISVFCPAQLLHRKMDGAKKLPRKPGWGHRGVSLYQLSRYSRDPQAAGVWGVGPGQQLAIESHKQIKVHSRTASKNLSLQT